MLRYPVAASLSLVVVFHCLQQFLKLSMNGFDLIICLSKCVSTKADFWSWY